MNGQNEPKLSELKELFDSIKPKYGKEFELIKYVSPDSVEWKEHLIIKESKNKKKNKKFKRKYKIR